MSPSSDTNRIALHDWRWLFTFVFALLVLWTGLWRCIEVREFKPNAFFFCLVMSLLSMLAGFFYWQRKDKLGMVFGAVTAAMVLGYYLFAFTTEPEKDATYRVGLIIIAATAQLIAVLLPKRANA